jgi:flotillin
MSAIAVIVGVLVIGVVAIALTIKKLLFICQPNEVLIFSGGRTAGTGAGASVGYKAIKGGRKIKVPLLEVVNRIELTNMAINVGVAGAYSKGGIPLNVDGVANVKVAGQGQILDNAVERLMGKPKAEIMQIARETLEGNLRGVLATLTPEDVNSDKIKFAQSLMEEATDDLSRLGLVLDTLNIQNVSDEDGYLDAIGRQSSAVVRKNAIVAEAERKAESVQREAHNRQDTELVRIDNAIQTLKAETQKQVTQAQTSQAALVAESRGEIAALVAEAEAEIDVQKARMSRVEKQLEADVITPARAKMEAAINEARGDAAKIIEEGKAKVSALRQMTTVWKTAGDAGRDIFLMQKLHPLIETITDTVVGVKVDKVTVLGTGGGNGAGDLASQVIAGNEKMKAALGVDVVGALQSRLAQPAEVVTPTEVSAPVIEAQPEVAKAIPAPKARPANTAQRRMAAPPPAATPARPVG